MKGPEQDIYRIVETVTNNYCSVSGTEDITNDLLGVHNYV